jgi:cytosine deaminase
MKFSRLESRNAPHCRLIAVRSKEDRMDLILKQARLAGDPQIITDIGIGGGKILTIEPDLKADAEVLDLQGKLVSPGLVETHIHLDKSNILSRCKAERGDLGEAIQEVAKQKKLFTVEDIYNRAAGTLEKCLLQGTTHIRTQLEVDPGIGLRGFEAIKQLIADYKWAASIEICVFPQEDLLNNPGTGELMVGALKDGARIAGAAPYCDSDPHGQIDRIFEMAREFDVDIDMHLDFSLDPGDPDLLYVCELAEKFRYGGRVAIGHVTKLSAAPPELFEKCASRLAEAGVALIVLPSTDLHLMGRHMTHNVARGVTAAHTLLHKGANCALSTNNVLNPFTPFGDCSLVRMANLYANICQVGSADDTRECFHMISTRSAKLMNLKDYGLAVGNPADLAVLDATSPEQAVGELSPVLYVFKHGKRTVTRQNAVLHRPN